MSECIKKQAYMEVRMGVKEEATKRVSRLSSE